MRLCAPGYTGRKRGEVVRTRTVVSQARGLSMARLFWKPWQRPLPRGTASWGLRYHVLPLGASVPDRTCSPRLDGQYGTGAVLADLAGLAYVTRGKDYTLLIIRGSRRGCICPPTRSSSHPESHIARSSTTAPTCRWGQGVLCRVVVATHPATQRRAGLGSARRRRLRALLYEAPAGMLSPPRCCRALPASREL